ncbi:MAG: hypothetical protein KAH22_02425 [Thiotrichaceae bacterium]|nr:hypothetical protein [Thiotrichaceae bacterium]
MPNTPCPCHSKKSYTSCCEQLHQGIPAKTAEQLMRSRYSAYVLKRDNYLQQSWHDSTCPNSIGFDPDTQWLGLRILNTAKGKQGDTRGRVKFIARYKINGKAHRLEEDSEFIFENGHWYYVNPTSS